MRAALVLCIVSLAGTAHAQESGAELAPPPDMASAPEPEAAAGSDSDSNSDSDSDSDSASDLDSASDSSSSPEVTDLVPAPPGSFGAVPPPPPAGYRPMYDERPPVAAAPPQAWASTVDITREERRARALALREARLTLRREHPWRFRVGFFVTASPRSMNGFGPYGGDEERWAYPGWGLMGGANRWLRPRLRLDIDATLARVHGDHYSSGDHGAEGSLGLGLSAHSRTRVRVGGGLGVATVLARELDEATGTHFGWFGFRLQIFGEFGFFTAKERGVSIRVAPTFTWAPYDRGFAPGVIFGAAVEL